MICHSNAVEDLKQALENYNKYLELQFRCQTELMSIVEQQLKSPSNLRLIEKKDLAYRRMSVYSYYTSLADSFIDFLDGDYRWMMYDKFFSRKPVNELKEKYKISGRQILNIADKLMRAYVAKMDL